MERQINQNDRLLWQQFCQGDTDALTALYDKHFQACYDYGIRLCSDKQLVEDAIQDMFVKMMEKRSFINTPSNVWAYLLKCFRNRLIEKLRSIQKQESSADKLLSSNFSISFTTQPELILDDEQELLKKNLEQALTKLPIRQKEIIYLLFFNNFSYDEVADLLSIEKRTVYNLSHRALKKLRFYFQKISLFIQLALILNTI